MHDDSKVEREKVNLQKLITFLYTSNEQAELKVNKQKNPTIQFTLAIPKMKYLDIIQTKFLLNVYENYHQTWMNEI